MPMPLQVPLLADLHIPTTVQGVLAARIDRLPPNEKALLQTLAVIGKEFSLSLLKQVVQQSEDDLLRQLSRLQTSELIYERPAFPDVEYTFKHALTQEVAYNSLLVERRKVVHERAAKAIEEVYRSKLDDHYSELAHHYSRSGNTSKAVEYLQLAGQQAVQRSANAEAIRHLTTALELLNTLSETPERAQKELALQITLGAAFQAPKGYTAPEVESVYRRARELCRQVGETSQIFSALNGLRLFYYVRGKLQTAHELAGELLSLAQKAQDVILLVLAHQALGATSLSLGELVSAREHLEQGMRLYDPQQHRSHILLYGEDPGAICLCFSSWILPLLGYPDQAAHKSIGALTLAREIAHSQSLAEALLFAAVLHQFRREGHAAQERAEATVALCAEQGFPFWLAWGTILRGWGLAVQRQGEEGIAQLRQGLAASRATGAEWGRSYALALLAEAHGRMGQTKEGLAVLAEALAVVHTTGERFYEAELYRLKGQLTLQSKVSSPKSQVEETLPGRVGIAHQNVILAEAGTVGGAHPTREAEAEGYFLKAIEVARKQQAKSLELRATTSLAWLWQQQGKQKDAHQMLADIYDWFTEGFDTADLKEARALLEALNH